MELRHKAVRLNGVTLCLVVLLFQIVSLRPP
jgi:hypothetical protein